MTEGLGPDGPVWDAATFTKNRDRRQRGDVFQKFMAKLPGHPRVVPLLRDEHFLVDGTPIEACAPHKSFRPKDGSGADGSGIYPVCAARPHPALSPPKRAMVVTQPRIDLPAYRDFNSMSVPGCWRVIRMAEDDLGGFGDDRLRRVGARLLEAMHQHSSMCLQSLAEDRTEARAFGRFLDNSGVSSSEMLVTAGRRTGERAAGRHVLAIEDTTELNFPGHVVSKRGFGRSGNGEDIGLFIHPTIAVDAGSGGVIGLVGAQVINRTGGKVAPRKQRPTAEKESQRWLKAADEAGKCLAPRR